MNKAYLLTGGNLGDRQSNLSQAKNMIEQECGRATNASSLYETAAWGNSDQPSFLNQALEIATRLSASQLLRKILAIEKMMGRIRKEKYGPRIIDIDILLFNTEIFDLPNLKVPHPELQNRRFALLPLTEIAPDLIHPLLNKSIVQLLKECNDELDVKKFP